jgi:hypothetical protein
MVNKALYLVNKRQRPGETACFPSPYGSLKRRLSGDGWERMTNAAPHMTSWPKSNMNRPYAHYIQLIMGQLNMGQLIALNRMRMYRYE